MQVDIEVKSELYCVLIVVAGAAEFESLLDQVRDLHRRTDEITRSKTRLHENIRARLQWERYPPPLPQEQRELADEVVEALTTSRLSMNQVGRLFTTYFGRR